MGAWQWFFLLLVLALAVTAPYIRRGLKKFWDDFNRINNHGEDDIDVVNP